MKRRSTGSGEPSPAAQAHCPDLPAKSPVLRELLRRYKLSLELGDVVEIEEQWYVTHSGLLRLAARNHCYGIETEPVSQFCDPVSRRWVVRATVHTSSHSRGFVGYGDADPSNISLHVRGSELRVAETRAVNRALRKAYGLGLCSVEELSNRVRGGARPQSWQEAAPHKGNAEPRLRDRLLLLIRDYQLDAEQVKCYAIQFCGTRSLRDASRAQVKTLVEHLEQVAAQGREKLLDEIAGSSGAPKEAGKEAT